MTRYWHDDHGICRDIPTELSHCDAHDVWHEDGCPDCERIRDAWEADTDRALVDCAGCGVLAEPCDSLGVLPVCARCAEQDLREVREWERVRVTQRPEGCWS